MSRTYTGWKAQWYSRMWHGYSERTLAVTLRMIDLPLLLRVPERFTRPPRVLDVACGTRILLRGLLERVPRIEVYGLNASQEMLAQARQTLRGWPETHFLLAAVGAGELFDLPYQPGFFDLITCTNALHYFPQPGPTIAAFKRFLATRGQLVLEDFARREDPFPWRAFEWLLRQVDPDHVQAYSLAEAQSFCAQAVLQVHEAEAFRINWFWQGWALRTQALSEVQ